MKMITISIPLILSLELLRVSTGDNELGSVYFGEHSSLDPVDQEDPWNQTESDGAVDQVEE
jgi:hypothetical protein